MRGELKKDTKLTSGDTVGSLMTKGRGRIDVDVVIDADHLPPELAAPLADAELANFVDARLAG